jgi:hypothetical protein
MSIVIRRERNPSRARQELISAETDQWRKEVSEMKYTKPEVVRVNKATAAIQGVKTSAAPHDASSTVLNPKRTINAYESDE